MIQNIQADLCYVTTCCQETSHRDFNTLSFTDEEEGEFDSVIDKFNFYCNTKKNETYERYMFHSRYQFQGEPIEQFVTGLKLKAQTCQFENLKDCMIRDQLVLGVANTKVRERLLREWLARRTP